MASRYVLHEFQTEHPDPRLFKHNSLEGNIRGNSGFEITLDIERRDALCMVVAVEMLSLACKRRITLLHVAKNTQKCAEETLCYGRLQQNRQHHHIGVQRGLDLPLHTKILT